MTEPTLAIVLLELKRTHTFHKHWVAISEAIYIVIVEQRHSLIRLKMFPLSSMADVLFLFFCSDRQYLKAGDICVSYLLFEQKKTKSLTIC